MVIDKIPETVGHPGSYEAVLKGCSCPIIDNCYGRGYMGRSFEFVINENCLIHGNKKEEARND